MRCSLPVTQGQVLFILVTGQSVGDYGPFRLLVETLKPGESEFAALELDSSATQVVSGDSSDYPDSYTSNCSAGADGPDVVRASFVRMVHLPRAIMWPHCSQGTLLFQCCTECNGAPWSSPPAPACSGSPTLCPPPAT